MPSTRNASALGDAEGVSSTPANKRRKIASQPSGAAEATASPTAHDAATPPAPAPLRTNLRRRNAAHAPAQKAGESAAKEKTRAKRRGDSQTPARDEAGLGAAAATTAKAGRRSASRSVAAGTPPTLPAGIASNGASTTTPKRVLAPDSSPPPSPAPASSRAASPAAPPHVEAEPSHDGDVPMREAEAAAVQAQDADDAQQQDEDDDDDDAFGPTQASVGEASGSQPRFVPLFPVRSSPAPALPPSPQPAKAQLQRIEEQSEPPSASADAREEAEAEEALVSLDDSTTRRTDKAPEEDETANVASGEKAGKCGVDAQQGEDAARAEDAKETCVHAPSQQAARPTTPAAATDGAVEPPREPSAPPATKAATLSPPQVVVQQPSRAAVTPSASRLASPAPAAEAVQAPQQRAAERSSSLSEAPLSNSTEKESSETAVDDVVAQTSAGEAGAKTDAAVQEDAGADVEMSDVVAEGVVQLQEDQQVPKQVEAAAPAAEVAASAQEAAAPVDEEMQPVPTPATAPEALSSSASVMAAPVIVTEAQQASPPAALAAAPASSATAQAAPVEATDASSDLTSISTVPSADNSQNSSKPEAIKQAFLAKTPSPVEPIVIAPLAPQSSLAPPENGAMFSSSAEAGCGSSALQGVFSGAAASSSAADVDLHDDLFDGLGSQDFDDLELSPQLPARKLAVPPRPDSPSAKARDFRRSRSNRAAVGQGLGAMGPPVSVARNAKGKGKQVQQDEDSDDEFGESLFDGLTDADLDMDESWSDSSFSKPPAFDALAPPPGTSMFTTASRKPLNINAAALEAAEAKMRLYEMEADDAAGDSATPSRTVSPAVGFAAASTSKLPAPAPAPRRSTSGAAPQSQAAPARTRTPLGKLSDNAAAASPRANNGKQPAFARPASAAGIHESPSVRQVSTPQASRLANPSAAPVFATPAPRRPSGLATSITRPQTSNAKPSGLSRGFNAHTTPAAARSTPGGTSTPRVQLGQAPHARGARGRTTPKFTTPFKNGAKPNVGVADTQESPAGRTTLYAARAPSGTPSQSSQAGGARDRFAVPAANARTPGSVVGSERSGSGSRLRTASSGKPVFDLSRPRAERKSMRDYGLGPESVLPPAVRLQSEEIPVILNDPSQAAHYEFDDREDGKLIGPAQVLEYMHEQGAEHAEIKWVKNHWGLVLWKLAALARLKLEEFDWRFSSQEVCRQLLYRYEREINQAQRSAIKRIQEQDSSPAQPMILCVSEVPKVFEEDEHPFLELTDGWYRIRATLDSTLTRAVHKGHIKLGSKLAISGAKRVGTPDATDVLQALEVSALSIEGNATSLARWDARLGFAPRPFVATLRSLTPDGGTIPLMDIIITRIHPMGFQSAEREAEGPEGETRIAQEVWCEADEVAKQDEWEKKRVEVTSRIEAQFEGRARRLDNVVALLQERARGVVGDSSQSYAGATQNDINLDTLLDSSNPRSELARIPARLLPSLATLALARRTRAQDEARQAAETEIAAACPPRRSRDFRVVRFEDAGLPGAEDGWGGRRERSKRSVQLTVWDARKLGEDGLQEGKRYTVTNLIPIKRMAWRPKDEAAEIFLATRRDSRWRRIN